MLKQEITYEDFNGNIVTETLYFNMTKSELIEFEASYDGGVEETIRKIVETKDKRALIEQFKKIILVSYGVKSEDGKRFIKTPELRDEFTQTAAYDALFMLLASDDVAAAAFITGVLPKDLQGEVTKALAEENVVAAVPPPVSFQPPPPAA